MFGRWFPGRPPVNWAGFFMVALPALGISVAVNGLFQVIRLKWQKRNRGSLVGTLKNRKKVPVWVRLGYSLWGLAAAYFAGSMVPRISWTTDSIPWSGVQELAGFILVGFYGAALWDIWKNSDRIRFLEAGFRFYHRFFYYDKILRVEIENDEVVLYAAYVPEIRLKTAEVRELLVRIEDPTLIVKLAELDKDPPMDRGTGPRE